MYQVKAQAREILIYGDIGPSWFAEQSVEARDVVDALEDLNGADPIHVRINSHGGALADGVAIYNALRRHEADIVTEIDGYAYSVGSLIAMAGDTIRMPDNTMLMIHAPWAGVDGNAADMREAANVLDKHASTMASAYERGGKVDADAVAGWLDGSKDHYFTALEARNAGLIDIITPGLAIAAQGPRLATDRGNFMDSNIADIEAKATEKERQRIADIDRVFALGTVALVPQSQRNSIRKKAIEDSLSPEQTSALLLQALPHEDPVTASGANDAVTGSTRRSAITAGDDRIDKMHEGIRLALYSRANIATAEQKKDIRKNEFFAMSLTELARYCLQARGEDVRGQNRSQIVGRALSIRGDLGITHSTSDFPALLEDTLNKAVLKGWDEVEETWRMIAAPGAPITDFREQSRVAIGEYPTLTPLGQNGEYKYVTVGDRKEAIILGTYGSIIGIGREAIVNDDLAQFTTISRKQGRAASRLVGDLVYAVLTGNPTMRQDGVPLFDAQHNNIATVTGPPSVATLDNHRLLMGLQKDSDSHAHGLNLPLQRVIVPKALETTANVLRAAEDNPDTVGDRSPNPFQGTYEVAADARLDAVSQVIWYSSTNPDTFDTIEVGFLQGQEQPYLETKDGWTRDGVELKVRLDAAASPMDFRTFVRNAGA